MLRPIELLFLVKKYDVLIIALLFSIGVAFLVSKIAQRKAKSSRGHIPGRLGLPFIGETISFLSATNSTKGCYDFIRLRRIWLVNIPLLISGNILMGVFHLQDN